MAFDAIRATALSALLASFLCAPLVLAPDARSAGRCAEGRDRQGPRRTSRCAGADELRGSRRSVPGRAQRCRERGRNPERIRSDGRRRARRRSLRDAAAATAPGRSSPRRSQAREDAITAEAPKFAAEAWQKAATRFNEAATRVERNDLKNAQRRGAESEVLLRDAELIAIKGKC